MQTREQSWILLNEAIKELEKTNAAVRFMYF
jgi:hypothetical protein